MFTIIYIRVDFILQVNIILVTTILITTDTFLFITDDTSYNRLNFDNIQIIQRGLN